MIRGKPIPDLHVADLPCFRGEDVVDSVRVAVRVPVWGASPTLARGRRSRGNRTEGRVRRRRTIGKCDMDPVVMRRHHPPVLKSPATISGASANQSAQDSSTSMTGFTFAGSDAHTAINRNGVGPLTSTAPITAPTTGGTSARDTVQSFQAVTAIPSSPSTPKSMRLRPSGTGIGHFPNSGSTATEASSAST